MEASRSVRPVATRGDWERLRDNIGELPKPVARPILVVVSGLPGTGKSFFSRHLSEDFPLAVLETDSLRRALVERPTYDAQESARLFRACHRLIAELLRQSIPALLDATNLVEANRELLYHIADQVGAKLVMIQVMASEVVVRQRLKARNYNLRREDHSEADWGVYQKMRSTSESIGRDHYVVDTSRDITPAIGRITKELWRWLRP